MGTAVLILRRIGIEHVLGKRATELRTTETFGSQAETLPGGVGSVTLGFGEEEVEAEAAPREVEGGLFVVPPVQT